MDSVISDQVIQIFNVIVFYCVRPSLLLLGIINCSISAHVFLRMGLGDSVRMSFFVLCLYDLGFLLMSSVGAVCIILNFAFSDLTSKMTFNPFYVNNISYWCANIFYHSTLMTTGYISGVRCCCVAIPLKFKNVFSTRRTLVILLAIFIISCSIQLPVVSTQYVEYVRDKKTNVTKIVIQPTRDYDLAVAYNDVINRNILSWVTVTIMTISLIVMAVKLRSSLKFRQIASKGIQKNRNQTSDNKSGCAQPIQIRSISTNIVGRFSSDQGLDQSEDSGYTSEIIEVSLGSTKNSHFDVTVKQGNSELKKDLQLTKESTKELQVVKSVTIITALFLALALPFMVYSLVRRFMPQFNLVDFTVKTSELALAKYHRPGVEPNIIGLVLSQISKAWC
ncbi:hypothetical protein Btru_065952 [Bulinus truncatus]|nr:hypothetical protein Btru_065952 [Bulinus truncatus]